MTDKEIYISAIEIWGPDKQMLMVLEECAELMDAICKFDRGRVGKHAVVEEIADVSIMLDQMILIMEAEGEFAVIRDQKMRRLQSMVEDKKDTRGQSVCKHMNTEPLFCKECKAESAEIDRLLGE